MNTNNSLHFCRRLRAIALQWYPDIAVVVVVVVVAAAAAAATAAAAAGGGSIARTWKPPQTPPWPSPFSHLGWQHNNNTCTLRYLYNTHCL